MGKIFETFSAGTHFLRSYVDYKVRHRPRPISAAFAVCNRCNLTCRYCNSPFLTDRELTLTEINLLFKNLKRAGVFRLGLTGGEPLLREDLGEIISASNSYGFFTSINSNLLLYADKQEIFEKIKFVFTSLDGPPEVHEKSRGPGSSKDVMYAISDLRRRRKNVVAITVVTESNIDSIEELVSHAEKNDFKLHFQPRASASPETDVTRGTYSERFENATYRAAWQKILDLKKQSRHIASSKRYLETIIAWQNYRKTKDRAGQNHCAAGYGYIYIDSAAKAYPCCLVKSTVRGIDMLQEDWRTAFDGKKPCNTCIAGPYLQFNLLYHEPLASFFDLYSAYGN
jgi:MoaA/NifB/PqqE/SkfB family radical SAM enzyme